MSRPALETARTYQGEPSSPKLIEIALFFLKIGIVGFGGPLVHIAMMEDELGGLLVWSGHRNQ